MTEWTRCHLIYTDKLQLASFTYYSLFAARIICRRLSCFCMRYQSVTQYSISIPCSTLHVPQLQLPISYMLPILTTPWHLDSVTINEGECHICSYNFVAIDLIARSENTGGMARVLRSGQETISDGSYSHTSGTVKLSSFKSYFMYRHLIEIRPPSS